MSGVPATLLRIASWIVPRDQRTEWLAEWQSELCYLQRCRGGGWRFCLGAIPDALWLRRNVPRSAARGLIRLHSPIHCLLFLAVLAGLSVLLAFRLPDARALFLPFPYPEAKQLALISPPGHFQERIPTVAVEDYRLIAHRMDAAFYRPARARVSAGGRSARLSVVLASGNLFELLGIRIAGPALVLSDSAARKHFADTRVAEAEVDGRRFPVAAVIAADFWRLPGRADAWLIDDARLEAIPPQTTGYVLGRTREVNNGWRRDLIVPNGEGHSRRFECAALEHQQSIPANLAVLAISLLLLPMLISWQRGDYPQGTTSPRRWIFLAAKIALVLPIVYFGTFDIASATVMGLQPHGQLICYIAAFRWVLADQRRRCPVCLRLLTNPIRIGRPSQTFLEGWGTELMCGQGHGLLRVPEMPESSSSTQSWLTLEQSWSSLFS